MREALFDILGPALEGARVLDAYAGTGALGFEALSRGASRVTFLECDPEVLEILRRNAASLGAEDRCRILRGKAEVLVAGGGAGGPFDLALVDPPYESSLGPAFLGSLAASGILAPGARVVVQRDARTEPADTYAPSLVRVRSVRYGRTCLDFYRLPAGR